MLLVMLFLFLLLGSFFILYALGDRFNFKKLSFEATGGIYVATSPLNASLTLDGKPTPNTSDLINTGTLIGNLPSGTYDLSVSASGYSAWNKKIKVKPGIVTIYNNVVLVPKDAARVSAAGIATSTLQSGISSLKLAGDNLAVVLSNGLLYLNGKKLVGNKIIDTGNSGAVITYSYLADAYYLSGPVDYSSPINLSAEFYADALNLLSPGEYITDIRFSSVSNQYLLVRTNLALYGLNLGQHSATLISGRVSAYASSGNEIYWLNKGGLESYNAIFQIYRKFSVAPPDNSGVRNLIPLASDLLALYNDGNLFILSGGQAPEVLATDTVAMVASSNSQGLAYIASDGTITEYSFLSGERQKMATGLPISPSSLSWYADDAHLFFQSGDSLYFSEIDGRNSPLNTVKISSVTVSYVYDYAGNTVYFTDGQKIYRLVIPD